MFKYFTWYYIYLEKNVDSRLTEHAQQVLTEKTKTTRIN